MTDSRMDIKRHAHVGIKNAVTPVDRTGIK